MIRTKQRHLLMLGACAALGLLLVLWMMRKLHDNSAMVKSGATGHTSDGPGASGHSGAERYAVKSRLQLGDEAEAAFLTVTLSAGVKWMHDGEIEIASLLEMKEGRKSFPQDSE